MRKKLRNGCVTTETSVEDEIAHLRGLDLKGLRARWQSVLQRSAPDHLPRHLLFAIIAYRIQADSMAAPAGKLTTTAPFFIGGILRRKEDTKVDHSGLTPAGGDKGKGKHHPGPAKTLNKNLGTPSRLKRSFLWG